MASIQLDDNDIRQVAHVAYDRGLPSIMSGAKNVNGGMTDPFLRHLIGAAGECAVAKHLDVFWDCSVGRFRGMGNDVGAFQVRARREPLPLIIRPVDSDQDIFILVYMTDKTFRNWKIAGWISGAEGKRVGTLTNMQGGQRYLVNESRLHSMEDLKVTA